MSSPLQQLLDQHLPLPGVAAWAVRMPDFAVGQESFMEWFSPDQVAQFLGRMIQAVENLRRNHIEPLQLCWVFENTRVHLAARPDGGCLALFVENRPDLPKEDVLNLMAGFLDLEQL